MSPPLVSLLAIALAACAIALILYHSQHRLVFRSEFARISPEDAEHVVRSQGAEELEIPVEGATLHGFFLPAAPGTVFPAPTVIYFGGNSEALARRAPDLEHLRELGWNVVLPCYRGYGLSSGTATTLRVLADSTAVFDHVVADPRVDASCVALWGRSLGTGVATHVAAHRPVAGLVLACPFARLSDVASVHYPWLPVRRFFTQEIDSLSKAPALQTPALILHGDLDIVVPVEQAHLLASAWNPPPRVVIFEGRGHHDLQKEDAYREEIDAFLRTLRA